MPGPSPEIKKPYEEIEEVWSNSHHGWEPILKAKTPHLNQRNRYLFTIHRRHGPPDKQCDTVITVHSVELIERLRVLMNDDLEIHRNPPQVVADKVYLILDQLRQRCQELWNIVLDDWLSRELAALRALLEWLEEAYFEIKAEFQRLVEKNQISYKLLWLLLPPRAKACTKHVSSGEPLGVLIDSAEYVPMGENLGSFFNIRGSYYWFDGETWQTKETEAQVMRFQGTRRIDSLPVAPLTPAFEESLTQRGSSAVDFAGVRYLQYSGALVRRLGDEFDCRSVKERAEGRCMVDINSYRRIVPDHYIPITPRMYGASARSKASLPPDKTTVDRKVEDESLWRLSPTLLGFSFVLKRWGELLVDQLSVIKFDQDAFNHLVLPETHKELIRGLVESSGIHPQTGYVKDVISQKGGGLIFCLYGSAGCGKTLTAEAVAEILERPLYNIGSGELGIEPREVEKNLRDALDVAAVWNAVVLIDEADVYLQERGFQNLARNALVSVFLRLLDYHKGILFLTTNRVKTFDPAFISRISIAIKYQDLTQEARKKIWTSFFERAGIPLSLPDTNHLERNFENTTKTMSCITEAEIEQLSERAFDGRIIRNMIQTAQGLALSRREGFCYGHLSEVIEASEDFLADSNYGPKPA